MYDLNDADVQTTYELVPPSIYELRAKVRGDLKLAKNLRTQHIDLELEIVAGEYSGRRVWDLITVSVDESSQPDFVPDIEPEQLEKFRKAVKIGRSRLRALIESANEIMPDDQSDRARALRQCDINNINGVCCFAKIGIKKGTNGFADRNSVQYFVTPDMKEWPTPRKAQPKNVITLPALRDARSDLNDEIPF